ncbi:DUF3179 domain-containing protein [Candidatus Woesearchaeota archaeon]|nr:DUF3179 domain-containing protein [Candidatus Woesearchaeota archaeon]
MKRIITIFSLITIIFLIGCTGDIPEDPFANEDPGMVQVPAEASDDEGIKVTKDGVKYLVDPKKILGGGPPKDGIPSIDNPVYVSVKEADEWIEDNELVLAIIHKDHKRVYPLQILVWHEIVNDVIEGDPLLITYCPLCGSGIAYERKITVDEKDMTVEFGTSGKLYNSNLVMYDRETNTYWSQIDGNAIVGELTGQELKEVSIDTVAWRDWKKEHPDSDVLSQFTDYSRPYGKDPYGSYYEESNLFFPVENEDNRIHPKDVVFGVEDDGTYIAYREIDLLKGDIDDTANGIKVARSPAGIVKVMKGDVELVKERGFWFSWYAFHPNTELYELN